MNRSHFLSSSSVLERRLLATFCSKCLQTNLKYIYRKVHTMSYLKHEQCNKREIDFARSFGNLAGIYLKFVEAHMRRCVHGKHCLILLSLQEIRFMNSSECDDPHLLKHKGFYLAFFNL